ELADEGFVLDSILNVVDCRNFDGYADNSYTAQLQAKYTDLVLLTKHEFVSERDLDRVIDRVNDLNTDAPKVYVNVDEPVSPELIFGLDTKLFELQGAMAPDNKAFQEEVGQNGGMEHHKNELDTMEIKCFASEDTNSYQSLAKLEEFLGTLDKDSVYRLKGFVKLSGISSLGSENPPTSEQQQSSSTSICVVNHAFGKWTVIPVPKKEQLLEPTEQKCQHDHDHDHDHSDSSHGTCGQGLELQMHLIVMGDLWSVKHKLIYGCGSAYPSGRVVCAFRSGRETIEWSKPLPTTYDEFITEQAALKRK
ncbi:hypothetical protein BX616_002538, partial [Lobosporangium transversale]